MGLRVSASLVSESCIFSHGLRSHSLHCLLRWGCRQRILVVNVKVEPDQVMDLLQAAHFLGIKSLLNVAATMVAHHLAGNF